MSGPQPASPADDDGPGILGNLPRTRPSVRSPRRAEAAHPAPDPATEATVGDREAAADPASASASGPGARSREQELEELARAGISLAGGAATLGLRAAGRAAAALRGAVERK